MKLFSTLAACLFVASMASAQQCNTPGPYIVYHGNPLLPKINVISGNFTMGQNTQVRLEAGLAFIEGFACLVIQEDTDNIFFTTNVPGIAGLLYICPTRPFAAFFEGQLLGGLNAGNSPVRTLNVPFNPALCGYRLGAQGFVTTEIFTNATFTQYTVGVLH